jgi:hypothetical protein
MPFSVPRGAGAAAASDGDQATPSAKSDAARTSSPSKRAGKSTFLCGLFSRKSREVGNVEDGGAARPRTAVLEASAPPPRASGAPTSPNRRFGPETQAKLEKYAKSAPYTSPTRNWLPKQSASDPVHQPYMPSSQFVCWGGSVLRKGASAWLQAAPAEEVSAISADAYLLAKRQRTENIAYTVSKGFLFMMPLEGAINANQTKNVAKSILREKGANLERLRRVDLMKMSLSHHDLSTPLRNRTATVFANVLPKNTDKTRSHLLSVVPQHRWGRLMGVLNDPQNYLYTRHRQGVDPDVGYEGETLSESGWQRILSIVIEPDAEQRPPINDSSTRGRIFSLLTPTVGGRVGAALSDPENYLPETLGRRPEHVCEEALLSEEGWKRVQSMMAEPDPHLGLPVNVFQIRTHLFNQVPAESHFWLSSELGNPDNYLPQTLGRRPEHLCEGATLSAEGWRKIQSIVMDPRAWAAQDGAAR